MKNLLFISLLGIMLCSCVSTNLFVEPKSDRKDQTVELDSVFYYDSNYEYLIRKNDKISISVSGHEQLSVGSTYGIYNSNEIYGKWLMVDQEGNIEIPKIGAFKAMGKTVIVLKEELKQLLGKWLVNPVVDIKILNKEITVLGEVREPQVIKIDKDDNTLLEIISQCNGFEFYADIENIKILRQQGKNVKVATVDLSDSGDYSIKNIQLHASDVVIIPAKNSKTFDKRVSIIVPLATTVTAAVLLFGAFAN